MGGGKKILTKFTEIFSLKDLSTKDNKSKTKGGRFEEKNIPFPIIETMIIVSSFQYFRQT